MPSSEYPTIQSAVDCADDYTEIRIGPGVYTEQVDLRGKIVKITAASEPPIVRNPDGYAFLFHKAEGPDTSLTNLVLAGGKYAVFISDASPTLRNLTIADNDFGVNADGDDAPTISNCIFWNNAYGDLDDCHARYSCLSGGCEEDGNLDADPLFADSKAGDYHLRSQEGRFDPRSGHWVLDPLTSPCINAGNPACPVGDEPTPNGGIVNMGAYGGTAYASKKSGAYGGGAGTIDDPWQIRTAGDLEVVSGHPAHWGAHFALVGDVDLGERTFERAVLAWDADPSRSGFQGIAFTGTFDGRGHIVHNLDIRSSGEDRSHVGLFGMIGEGGQVRNLHLLNVSVRSGEHAAYVGMLAGQVEHAVILNCSSWGTIRADEESRHVGGLVGAFHGSSVMERCSSSGHVHSKEDSDNVGGLVGWSAYGSDIRRSYADCVIHGDEAEDVPGCHGGLVGFNDGSSIVECLAVGDVTAKKDVVLGGLVGRHGGGAAEGQIVNCYSLGNVVADGGASVVGGAIGICDDVVINSYSTGVVGADAGSSHAGGFIGLGVERAVGCFWDVETSGAATSPGADGKTTEQMMCLSTFVHAGWQFDGEDGPLWRVCTDGADYPRLVWHAARRGDLRCPDGAGMEDLRLLAESWLADDVEAYRRADVTGDGRVLLDDFDVLSTHWNP